MRNYYLMFVCSMTFACSVGINAQTNQTVTKTKDLWKASDKAGWTASASSAQGLSDGNKGGPASLMIDGDNTTYWHSTWEASVVPGATLDFDLGKQMNVCGIIVQQRAQENRRIKAFKLYTKANASAAWSGAVVSKNMENTTDKQYITFSNQSAQFLRIEIVSSQSGAASNVCLAEFGVQVKENYAKADYDAMLGFLNLPIEGSIDKTDAATRSLWTSTETNKQTPYINLNMSSLTLGAEAASKDISITTNIPSWNAKKTQDWVTLSVTKGTPGTVSLGLTENKDLSGRTDTISVFGSSVIKKLTVKQNGVGVSDNLIPTDIYIAPTSANSTTNYSGSHTASNLYDRNPNGNNFHTAVNGSSSAKTENVEYFFVKKAARIDYLMVLGGTFGNVTVYAKQKGSTDYENVGSFTANGDASKIAFATPLETVGAIKIEFVVPAEGFKYCKEIECWKVNDEAPLNDAVLKVFTDLSCSQIKTDAQTADVEALPSFYKIIYNKLKDNSYNKQYRIATYKAYSDPDKFATVRNTNAYSILDNPTGILAKSGDSIYVLVGNTEGRDVAIMSVTEKSVNRTSYALKEGINKIKITRTGLLYVSYIADLTTNPQPINIHIPEGSGEINGYWDITKNTNDQWPLMLDNAKHSVIDILGKNFQAVLFVDECKNNLSKSAEISKSVELWDDLVESEWNFMGFDKYPQPQNNRMCGINFEEKDGAPMWATWYTTGYNKYTTIPEVLYPGGTTGNKLWGMGHETGHCNQHPFNWKSMSETSNNTFAQVALEEVINKKYRKITDATLDNAATDMEPPIPNYINKAIEGVPFHDLEGWGKFAAAYYQLYLYFVKNEVQPDFFKDIFESLRHEGLGNDYLVAERHINWYKRACDISKLDLTEHFDTYGWFTPIDVKANQYGEYWFKLTEEMANEAKAYVAAKGYAKPAQRTQFIHQHGKIKPVTSLNGYWTYYRDNAIIREDISCSFNANSGVATVTNGIEAAAFAVETGGKIVMYADRATFTVPAAKRDATTKIYAVPIQTSKELVQIYPAK